MDEMIPRLAGQRLMLGFNGTKFNKELETIIREYQAGGIILFKPNIISPDQVAALCTRAQAFAASLNLPPLFIAVDQEGGAVSRLPPPFTRFDGNPGIQTREQAAAFARITAGELKQAGINMNLAPVMDVVPPDTDSIMKTRAFPGNADAVADLGTTVIKTLQSSGIMAVAKHFPGIGRTVLDSHHHLPELDVELSDLKAVDLVPFEAAVRADAAGIMISHILYPRLDSRWQASLSKAIARDLIRHTLGFDGLVLTDDLDMKAIDQDMDTCMAQVLASEIDLALICHQGPDIEKAVIALTRQLTSDPKARASGRRCVQRIYRYKEKYLGWKKPDRL